MQSLYHPVGRGVIGFFFTWGNPLGHPGGDRVVSDSNQLKPHGDLPDASQKWPGFSCEILPEHFFVFSLFVVKGSVFVLTWAARRGKTTNPLTPLPRTVVQVRGGHRPSSACRLLKCT